MPRSHCNAGELETLNCSVYTETADSEEKYLLMEQAVTNSQVCCMRATPSDPTIPMVTHAVLSRDGSLHGTLLGGGGGGGREVLALMLFGARSLCKSEHVVWIVLALVLQLVVVVISKYTADCKECQKLFSLCYVSDKPIVSAATNNKEELLDKLTVAM